MKEMRLIRLVKDFRAALWLAWHWKDLRQDTRDAVFQDMVRIRGYRRKIARKGKVRA